MRSIHGEIKYTQLKFGTRTNLGVRQDLRVPDIRQVVSSRRLGLLKRVLDSDSKWMLGLIVEQWDQPRGWAKEVKTDLQNLAKVETGISPTQIQILAEAKEMTKKKWKARVKTAQEAQLLMDDTKDDLENLEKFQQAAFGSIGLKVGAPEPIMDWACPVCQKCFPDKQAMRILPLLKKRC